MSDIEDLSLPVEANKVGLTLTLFNAIRTGDLCSVKHLISKFGVSYRRNWYRGYSLLYEAILHKQFDVAHYLLSMGAEVNLPKERKVNLAKRNKSVNSALHLAVEQDDIKLIYTMLLRGCDVNDNGADEEKPLHKAVRCNQLEAVKALLEYNSDINCTTGFGATPIFLAVEGKLNPMPMLRLLGQYHPDLSISTLNNVTPLLLATFNSKTDAVRYLLELGADHNVTDSYGRTLLSIASENGNEDLCQLFISKGIDVNKYDNNIRIPLHYASKYGYFDITNLLLSAGSIVNSKDKNGLTPLHYASNKICDAASVTKLLLKHGANPNETDFIQATPLHRAIHLNNKRGINNDMVRLLLENGSDPNSLNKCFCSPLHLSAINGDIYNFSHLICYGGNVNLSCDLIDYKSNSCLSLARWRYENLPYPFYNAFHECAVKWKNIGLLNISEESMNSLNKDTLPLFQIYEKQCQTELNNISNTKHIIYLLLTKPINDVFYLARNESIQEYLLSDECVKRFPLYHSIMKMRWGRAKIRFKLMLKCQDFYQWLESILPNCSKLIFSYLSDADLKLLSNKKWLKSI